MNAQDNKNTKPPSTEKPFLDPEAIEAHNERIEKAGPLLKTSWGRD